MAYHPFYSSFSRPPPSTIPPPSPNPYGYGYSSNYNHEQQPPLPYSQPQLPPPYSPTSCFSHGYTPPSPNQYTSSSNPYTPLANLYSQSQPPPPPSSPPPLYSPPLPFRSTDTPPPSPNPYTYSSPYCYQQQPNHHYYHHIVSQNTGGYQNSNVYGNHTTKWNIGSYSSSFSNPDTNSFPDSNSSCSSYAANLPPTKPPESDTFTVRNGLLRVAGLSFAQSLAVSPLPKPPDSCLPRDDSAMYSLPQAPPHTLPDLSFEPADSTTLPPPPAPPDSNSTPCLKEAHLCFPSTEPIINTNPYDPGLANPQPPKRISAQPPSPPLKPPLALPVTETSVSHHPAKEADQDALETQIVDGSAISQPPPEPPDAGESISASPSYIQSENSRSWNTPASDQYKPPNLHLSPSDPLQACKVQSGPSISHDSGYQLSPTVQLFPMFDFLHERKSPPLDLHHPVNAASKPSISCKLSPVGRVPICQHTPPNLHPYPLDPHPHSTKKSQPLEGGTVRATLLQPTDTCHVSPSISRMSPKTQSCASSPCAPFIAQQPPPVLPVPETSASQHLEKEAEQDASDRSVFVSISILDNPHGVMRVNAKFLYLRERAVNTPLLNLSDSVPTFNSVFVHISAATEDNGVRAVFISDPSNLTETGHVYSPIIVLHPQVATSILPDAASYPNPIVVHAFLGHNWKDVTVGSNETLGELIVHTHGLLTNAYCPFRRGHTWLFEEKLPESNSYTAKDFFQLIATFSNFISLAHLHAPVSKFVFEPNTFRGTSFCAIASIGPHANIGMHLIIYQSYSTIGPPHKPLKVERLLQDFKAELLLNSNLCYFISACIGKGLPWDPGGQFSTFTAARFSSFKQWVPEKFVLGANFYNLEDKVGLHGVGNDRNSTIQYLPLGPDTRGATIWKIMVDHTRPLEQASASQLAALSVIGIPFLLFCKLRIKFVMRNLSRRFHFIPRFQGIQ